MSTIWTPRWPKRRFFIVYELHQGGRDVTWKGTMPHFQIPHNPPCLPPPPPPKFQILLSGPHIPKAFLNNLCNLWEENRVLYEFLFWQPLDNVAVLVDNKYSTVFLLLKFARKISLVPSWKQIKTKQNKKTHVNQHAAMKSGANDFLLFSCKIAQFSQTSVPTQERTEI